MEECPGAEAAHSSGPFLLTDPLIAPLGQTNSILVAVAIFLLLTSMTYLLFKLSPRSVAKGCVCVCVHVLLHVCVRICVCMWMCVSVCVHMCVVGHPCPCVPPLPTIRSWMERFQASALDQLGIPKLPGFEVGRGVV